MGAYLSPFFSVYYKTTKVSLNLLYSTLNLDTIEVNLYTHDMKSFSTLHPVLNTVVVSLLVPYTMVCGR